MRCFLPALYLHARGTPDLLVGPPSPQSGRPFNLARAPAFARAFLRQRLPTPLGGALPLMALYTPAGTAQASYARFQLRYTFPMAFRVFAYGEDPTVFDRPCVDCGRYTGSFCERECLAALRVPREYWEPGQRTPHCTACERRYVFCHFCRGASWCTPPGWRPRR